MRQKTKPLVFFDFFRNFYQLFSNHLHHEESQKKRPEYEAAAIEALSFSPAISSKYRKFVFKVEK